MTRSASLDVHLGRLVILLDTFESIDGLTKLAKLDFLLRYPALMGRLSEQLGFGPQLEGVLPTDDEMTAVESRMVRYKYGPWDDRYYPIVGALIGLGLARPGSTGPLQLSITKEGRTFAAMLADDPLWRSTRSRAEFLRMNFDLTGNALKDLIYDGLPEAMDRPWRAAI